MHITRFATNLPEVTEILNSIEKAKAVFVTLAPVDGGIPYAIGKRFAVLFRVEHEDHMVEVDSYIYGYSK